MYRLSDLFVAMRDICAVLGAVYFLYGDSIYQSDVSVHLKAPFLTRVLNVAAFLGAGNGQAYFDDKVAQNKAWSALRLSVEWGFGDVKRYWKKIDRWTEQKMMRETQTEGDLFREYAVAFFLTNCISATYGNNASRYFKLLRGIDYPSLEEYLNDYF